MPINQVLPSTNEGLVVSNKVTVEVNIGKNSFAHDSYHIHIFVDEEFVGGSASLKDGVHGDSFQTSLGLHSIKLAVISSKNEIRAIGANIKIILPELYNSPKQTYSNVGNNKQNIISKIDIAS